MAGRHGSVNTVTSQHAADHRDVPVGAWVCPNKIGDGRIEPDWSGIVPCCPVCDWIALRKIRDKRGKIGYREPTPATCAGPEHHDLTRLGSGQVGWGGHPPGRLWKCGECGDVQHWPRRPATPHG